MSTQRIQYLQNPFVYNLWDFEQNSDEASDDSWNSDSDSSTNESKKEEKDWQLKRPNLCQQNEYILKYSLMTDCTFKVGKESDTKVFQCHKLLLSKTSPVFEAMLYGPLAEKEIINITDIQPDIFNILLKYIYTSKLPEMINYDSALSLCYAAKKYMLQRVVNLCVKYLWNTVTPATACSGYEFAKLMEIPELAAKCIKVIQEQAKVVIADKNFLEIEQTTLVTILIQNNLNIKSEDEIISAATSWAKAEATRQNLPSDGKSLRHVLGTAFQHLRFLSLNLTHFVAGPMKSDLLTSDEKIAIMSCIESSSTETLTGSSISKIKIKRNQIELQLRTIQCKNTLSNSVAVRNKVESIVGFTFTSNVLLKGINIDTSHLWRLVYRNILPKPYKKTQRQGYSIHYYNPSPTTAYYVLQKQNIKIYLQKSHNKSPIKLNIKEIEENRLITFENNISFLANKHYKLMVYIKHNKHDELDLIYAPPLIATDTTKWLSYHLPLSTNCIINVLYFYSLEEDWTNV